MCLNIGTLKTVNFPFGTNGKLMVLGVPILKHFSIYKDILFCDAADVAVAKMYLCFKYNYTSATIR